MTSNEALFDFTVRQADNCLILGQRLGEWCGHGPVLEQDIALTNIALDLIGQSRSLYQYAAQVQGQGKTEDDLAYLRDAWDFRNFLLLEQPNKDFAVTIARQFYIDCFHYLFYTELSKSSDDQLKAIAMKSIKEVTYHRKWSTDWILRLGDGTEESHQRIQKAVEDLWPYTGEFFENNETDTIVISGGVIGDVSALKLPWEQYIKEVMTEATLTIPDSEWMHSGGKNGQHTEHLGYILADLQFLQRAYPDSKW